MEYFMNYVFCIEEGKNLSWQISMKWAWRIHIRGPIESEPNCAKVCYGQILHKQMQQEWIKHPYGSSKP